MNVKSLYLLDFDIFQVSFMQRWLVNYIILFKWIITKRYFLGENLLACNLFQNFFHKTIYKLCWNKLESFQIKQPKQIAFLKTKTIQSLNWKQYNVLISIETEVRNIPCTMQEKKEKVKKCKTKIRIICTNIYYG